jgi:formylglycine-generating enzyme required for sulfatase activity
MLSDLKEIHDEAESLLAELEFDAAEEKAAVIANETDSRLQQFAPWHEDFSARLESSRTSEHTRLEEQLREAHAHEQAYDYEAGLRTLAQVAPSLKRTTIGGGKDVAEELTKRLTAKQTRFKELEEDVDTRVAKQEMSGLLPIVNELVKLNPDRLEVQKLKEQLEKRDADLLEARNAAINKATQQLGEQQYAEAVATLNTVSAEVSSEQLEELKTKASDLLNQLDNLRDRITTAVDGNQLKGLLPAVEECLTLKTDQDDFLKLKEQLIDREAQMDARNQQIISEAQSHMQQAEYDKAVQLLGEVAQEYQTLITTELSQQAQELSVLRHRVLSAFPATSSEKRFKLPNRDISNYLFIIAGAGIQDPQLQQMLDDAKDKEAVSSRKRKLITLGIVAACVVVLIIKINLDAKAVKSFIGMGDWETVLELDSDNAEGLRMQAAAKAAMEKAAAEKVAAENAAAENAAAAEKVAAENAAAVERAAILAGALITNTIGMTLNKIPAGTFMMGSPGSETGRGDDETQHEVTISKAFYMQTTEVTRGQWTAVMGTEPWKGVVPFLGNVKKGTNYPACYVSREDAVAYCKKLSEKEGKTYRLPTEAEWEYACRAGTETAWSFGDDEKVLGDYAWYDKNAKDIGEGYAHQVGRKKPNAFGLYDMHGNVSEWCHDYFEEDYYKQSPEKDPTGLSSGSSRVLRGGTWRLNSGFTRSAFRYRFGADTRNFSNGFRLVRELD